MASLQNTATIGMSAGGGMAVAIWLCKPSWPPPDAVLALLVGYALPVIHLAGRGVYRRIAKWSGEPAEQESAVPYTQQSQAN